jgi:hypothetical protein
MTHTQKNILQTPETQEVQKQSSSHLSKLYPLLLPVSFLQLIPAIPLTELSLFMAPGIICIVDTHLPHHREGDQ